MIDRALDGLRELEEACHDEDAPRRDIGQDFWVTPLDRADLALRAGEQARQESAQRRLKDYTTPVVRVLERALRLLRDLRGDWQAAVVRIRAGLVPPLLHKLWHRIEARLPDDLTATES